MANLTLPAEVRRAFEAALKEAREYDHGRGYTTVDPDHAYDCFMANLEAEGYRVVEA